MPHLSKLAIAILILMSPSANADQPTDRANSTADQTRGADAAAGSIDVRKWREGDQRITEYRRFGHLYMLEVHPKGGAPLYLIDRHGAEGLDIRPAENIEDNVNLPKWRIGRF